MHRAHDLGLRFAVDPIRQLAEALMQVFPERYPISHRWRRGNRAEPREVFVVDFSVVAPGLDQADLQPTGGLAKSNKHVVA
jgi:hypothetical protein